MRREICWIEREAKGVRREIRVHIVGGKVHWRMRRDNEEGWMPKPEPSPADWSALLLRMENWYQRRGVPHAELELVRRLCIAAQPPEE